MIHKLSKLFPEFFSSRSIWSS